MYYYPAQSRVNESRKRANKGFIKSLMNFNILASGGSANMFLALRALP
jgi:hypothetical protein